MIEVYKILSGKYDTKAGDFIKLRADNTTRSQGKGNSKKIFVQRPRLDVRKHSFSIRVAKLWNSLPEQIVTARTTIPSKID